MQHPPLLSRRSATASLAALIFGLAATPALAAAAPPAAPGEATPDGRPIVIGRSYALPSRLLGDTRRINVYLPEHYDDPARRFPVLYLLDGGEREDFHHITGLAQINAAYGFGQEVIVVGIEGVDRRHDLTTPSTVAGDLKAAPTSGGAALYRRFLVEELRPWVEARYRTNGRSGLIGESLAGLFTLQLMLEAPASFEDYIAVSPSLWWNGGALAAAAATDLKRGDFRGRRLFLAFDDPPPPADKAAADRARQAQVADALAAIHPAGLEWTAVRPGESHGGIYHTAALQAFRRLYGPKP